jgi:hypothetical protein
MLKYVKDNSSDWPVDILFGPTACAVVMGVAVTTDYEVSSERQGRIVRERHKKLYKKLHRKCLVEKPAFIHSFALEGEILTRKPPQKSVGMLAALYLKQLFNSVGVEHAQ